MNSSIPDRKTGLIKCPTCTDGVIVGMHPVYAPGYTGKRELTIDVPCDRCHGSAKIPMEMAVWMTHGRNLREIRLTQFEMGLRRAAKAWNVLPSELCKVESGKVNNIKIKYPPQPGDLPEWQRGEREVPS